MIAGSGNGWVRASPSRKISSVVQGFAAQAIHHHPGCCHFSCATSRQDLLLRSSLFILQFCHFVLFMLFIRNGREKAHDEASSPNA